MCQLPADESPIEILIILVKINYFYMKNSCFLRLDLDLNETTTPLWIIFVVFSPDFQALVCSCSRSGRSGERSVPYSKASVYSQELFFINLNWSIQSSLEIKIASPTLTHFVRAGPALLMYSCSVLCVQKIHCV